MDLWIRSQDKEDLIKVYSLEVASRSNDKYTILTLINSSTLVDLGTYETKERALEVLDEIQELFTLRIENETLTRADLLIKARMLPVIYQMPKE